MILNLNNQQQAVDQIQPYINAFKDRMDLRKAVWDKLDNTHRKAWVLSDKDPIMSLAFDIWKYLKNNFYEEYING